MRTNRTNNNHSPRRSGFTRDVAPIGAKAPPTGPLLQEARPRPNHIGSEVLYLKQGAAT